MTGRHSGSTVDYGDGRLARAVVEVDGTGATHSGYVVDLGNGKYALAVQAASLASGAHRSGSTVQMADGTLARATMPVEIGSAVHSGSIVDFGDGRLARAVVVVDSPAAGQLALPVVRLDSDGNEVEDGEAVDNPTRWGVVLHLPLNEVSDGLQAVTRSDLQGANDATDNNTVTNATGKIAAQCAQFTAANNEYLSIEDNADLSVGDIDFWLSGWFKFDSLGVLRGLVGRRTSTAARDYVLFYDTNAPNANRLKFRIYNAAGTEIVSVAHDVALATGTWYFVVCYHDATNDLIGISVNGSAFTTAATGGAAPADVNARFLVGILQATTTNPHNGQAESISLGKSPALGIAALADEIRDTQYAAGAGLAYPWS
jgi:hypothetical protein